jgi:hypothetical protein
MVLIWKIPVPRDRADAYGPRPPYVLPRTFDCARADGCLYDAAELDRFFDTPFPPTVYLGWQISTRTSTRAARLAYGAVMEASADRIGKLAARPMRGPEPPAFRRR